MEGDKESNLIELKTELATVVEALNVLQDFIESVFGTKYQSFVSSNLSEREGNGYNIQLALRKLRSKNSKRGNEDIRRLSTQSSGGLSPVKDAKGNSNTGYSSTGGTPVTVTSLSEEGRRDSSSSKVYSPVEDRYAMAESEFKEDNDSYRFSLSVGRPEVVAVKCELEDTDFLDDMEPFGSEHGDYNYEGEESEIKIEDCYPLSNHLSDQDNHNIYQEASPIPPSEHPNIQTNSSSRFIPELIPIRSDPLLQSAPQVASTAQARKEDEDASDSISSENSDTEWHPVSSVSRASSQRSKTDKRKLSTKRSLPPERKPIVTNFPPNLLDTSPRQQSSTLPFGGYNGGGSGGGGPFKCDMCPASYKQEESLRSHQKYKHNPSRVQCTCHLCGKSMVDKYRLQRHLRLHTGEKPFECEYCGQSFYRKDYHTKHLQRKHGISYNAGTGNPSRVLKKPAVAKQKPSISSSSPSSFTISPSSSTSSSSYQSLRSGVFETPSPPPPTATTCNRKPIAASSLAGQNSHRQHYFSTTTSPTSSSVTAPSSTISSREMTMRNEQGNYIDIFSNHSGVGHRSGGECFSGPNTNEYFSNSGAMGNLMTMTSLTFDDLISADL